MASDVICLLLIWMADGRTLEDRGLRATVALYCIRPDLIDGMTLDGIGVLAGCSGKRFISWQPRSATQRACKHEHRASTPSDARFWRR